MFKKRSAMKFRMGNPDIILAVPLDRGRLYMLFIASNDTHIFLIDFKKYLYGVIK